MQSYDLSRSERALVTTAVILAMLMQVLDTTIANVALPHMQTSLGATRETVNWVLTSYIVASAIAIPITGWLAEQVGRKRLFVWSVIAFTLASLLCAMAQNLTEMVLFRVIQGVAGAFLVPLAQAVMFDIQPARTAWPGDGDVRRRRDDRPDPRAGARRLADREFQLALGVPGESCRSAACHGDADPFLPTTPKLKRPFDLFGFALLALALGGLQMMLDRG
jgi:DHA2 family multidrug resistance protein